MRSILLNSKKFQVSIEVYLLHLRVNNNLVGKYMPMELLMFEIMDNNILPINYSNKD